ncbi:adenine phosphoribosyltransferase [Klebsiella pneumoniae]|nr:adenine phosphoribosyltransferase [Klebsiella pneumoniae]
MTATAQQLEYLKNSIQSIEDYPKPGILFRDVTSLLEDPKAYALSIELLTERYKDAGITKVVGTEARGFLFGAPVALALGVGFVPVRKPRKLPRETIAETYELEYGTDQLEIHVDAIKPGDKVLVVDDLLATGGTIDATVKLIRRLGGEVARCRFHYQSLRSGRRTAPGEAGDPLLLSGAVPGPLSKSLHIASPIGRGCDSMTPS